MAKTVKKMRAITMCKPVSITSKAGTDLVTALQLHSAPCGRHKTLRVHY